MKCTSLFKAIFLLAVGGLAAVLLSGCQQDSLPVETRVYEGIETAIALTRTALPSATIPPSPSPIPSATPVPISPTAPAVEVNILLPVAPGFTPAYLLPSPTVHPSATMPGLDPDATQIVVATASQALRQIVQDALSVTRLMRSQIEGALYNNTPVNCRDFSRNYEQLSALPTNLSEAKASEYLQARNLILLDSGNFYLDCLAIVAGNARADALDGPVWEPALQALISAELTFLKILQE